MEDVISQVTSDDFALSEFESDVEEGYGMYACRSSSSAVWEATLWPLTF